MRAKVIAVANQKGGVGKSTTVLNLGDALKNRGQKVLLIDFDPQGTLTIFMGIDRPDSQKNTMSDLLRKLMEDSSIFLKDYILQRGGLDFISSNIGLAAIEVSLVNAMSRELMLKSIVEKLRPDYDYILIDCPPSLGMLNINALTAADSVIIPVVPEYASAKGLELLLGSIIKIKKHLNPALDIMGILYTQYVGRFNQTKETEEMIKEAYDGIIPIFQIKIPTSVHTSDASKKNKAIYDYEEKNKVGIAYQNLSEEVIRDGKE